MEPLELIYIAGESAGLYNYFGKITEQYLLKLSLPLSHEHVVSLSNQITECEHLPEYM